MPDKNPDLWTIVLFHLAAVSGAMGGCAAGAAIGLKRREILFGQIVAYGLIGFVCGGASYAFGHLFDHPGDVKSIMGWAVAVGVGVPVILACHNFGARYAFRVFGVDVEFTMRKPGEERRSKNRRVGDD